MNESLPSGYLGLGLQGLLVLRLGLVGYPPLGKLCLKKGEKMEDFDKFWKEYPKKVAKGDARKAWLQTQKIRPDLDTLLKAVSAAKRTDQWRQDGGKYIPYPATWLRQERWEDQEVEIEDAVEVNGQIVNWWESATGIESKGLQLGLRPSEFDSWPNFKAEVMRRTMRAA